MAPDASTGADRDPAQIKAEIEATQARLARTVDDIALRVAPATISARLQAWAKGLAVDPATGPRYPRIAAVAGVVVVIVAIRVRRSRR